MVEIEHLTKRELRRAYRAKRRALPAALQRHHARALAEWLVDTFAPESIVGVYRADDGEIDLNPLTERLWSRGVATVLPVVDGGDIRFAGYDAATELRPGAFDLDEPCRPNWAEPTVVLVPLVAFDDRGARLGRGGGFYDRFLARAAHTDAIGVAHGLQRHAAELPLEAHDVRLKWIVTESGWADLATAKNL